MLAFLAGCAVTAGAITYAFWPEVKAKVLAWYDAVVAKI